MKRASIVLTIALLLSAVVYAQAPQTPAATPQNAAPKPATPASAVPPPTSGVAVIDFGRALTGNVEGVRATNKLQAEGTQRQNRFQAKLKEGQDAQAKLQTGGAVMNDQTRTDLTKKVDQVNIEAQRMQDDFQREMGQLQEEYLGPVAAVVRKVIDKYAQDKGYAIVFDTSGESNNIMFRAEAIDITDEVIPKIDDEFAKNPLSKAPVAAPATGAPRPQTPAATGAPRPNTNPPAANPPAPANPAAPKPTDPAKKP